MHPVAVVFFIIDAAIYSNETVPQTVVPMYHIDRRIRCRPAFGFPQSVLGKATVFIRKKDIDFAVKHFFCSYCNLSPGGSSLPAKANLQTGSMHKKNTRRTLLFCGCLYYSTELIFRS